VPRLSRDFIECLSAGRELRQASGLVEIDQLFSRSTRTDRRTARCDAT